MEFSCFAESLEHVFYFMRMLNPNTRPYILSGQSNILERGIGHAVVADATGILHDPNPSTKDTPREKLTLKPFTYDYLAKADVDPQYLIEIVAGYINV